MNINKGLKAISPLFVFVALYLVTSVMAGDFYKVPISVAFLISSIYAIAISGKGSLNDRLKTFSKGAGSDNIMSMLWIFLLAGAFANSAKNAGCVDATVNMMLTILPDNMLLAGLFVATCFISLSIGTSVGAIVALVPISSGLAATTGANPALMVAIVVGGAFFGDNLSFISDTTIAATSSQGCNMKDKFKVNSIIVFPTAIIILAVYALLGAGIETPDNLPNIDAVRIVPYLAVFITAIFGMNVMVVLTIGIALSGIIGISSGAYDVYGWINHIGSGMMGMSELIIITMLAGGLFEIVHRNGGIDYVIEKLTRHINGKRGAELVIASLVSVVDMCTANNTVAIITVGGISKKIGDAYGVDNRKAASILDTFSCCVQGIIPYGAQILMAANLSKLTPTDILPYLYYPYALGIFALLSILLRFPRKYS